MKLSFLQILTEIWDKNPQFWEVKAVGCKLRIARENVSELWETKSELWEVTIIFFFIPWCGLLQHFNI